MAAISLATFAESSAFTSMRTVSPVVGSILVIVLLSFLQATSAEVISARVTMFFVEWVVFNWRVVQAGSGCRPHQMPCRRPASRSFLKSALSVFLALDVRLPGNRGFRNQKHLLRHTYTGNCVHRS